MPQEVVTHALIGLPRQCLVFFLIFFLVHMYKCTLLRSLVLFSSSLTLDFLCAECGKRAPKINFRIIPILRKFYAVSQIFSVVLQPYFGALGLILGGCSLSFDPFSQLTDLIFRMSAANCCTMSIRIAYTLCFAYVRFEGLEQILNAIPHSKVMFIMSSLSAFTWFTSLTQGNAVHFGAGVLSLFGILASLLRYERGTLLLLRQLRRKEA